jgi:ABC-type transport system involved in cytochrome bd biosynthesis fused ATPase/permease subunit
VNSPAMRAPAHARPRAVDPRLLTYARATQPFLVALILLGGVTALLIIAQAWLLAYVIAAALAGGKGVAALRLPFEALLVVVLARGVVAWGREVLADRSSALAKSQLRAALLEHLGALGPERLGERRTGELAVLATRGIDALDGYFSLYLPQLVLAIIVPAAVLAVIADRDWISALIIAGTLPLIPLFMALVGAATRDRMELQFRTLQQLAGHFLDVVAGLPTLKVFGRAKAQIETIGEVTDRYRGTAMSTLRVTFLSSLILELVATISVALVAVEVGLRLMGGHLGLRTALLVLVLAPEAYLPLRLLGANYHASAEGMSAAHSVFDVLETRLPAHGRRTDVPDPAVTGISVDDLRVQYPGREGPALDGISLAIEPGEMLAITGPSGCGQVDAARRAGRVPGTAGRVGDGGRRGSLRDGPRCLAGAGVVDAATPSPVRRLDCRQRPARPPRRDQLPGVGCHRGGRTGRRGGVQATGA